MPSANNDASLLTKDLRQRLNLSAIAPQLQLKLYINLTTFVLS
jgi:hypothetical protein